MSIRFNIFCAISSEIEYNYRFISPFTVQLESHAFNITNNALPRFVYDIQMLLPLVYIKGNKRILSLIITNYSYYTAAYRQNNIESVNRRVMKTNFGFCLRLSVMVNAAVAILYIIDKRLYIYGYIKLMEKSILNSRMYTSLSRVAWRTP